MRLHRYDVDGAPQLAVSDGARVAVLPVDDVAALLADGDGGAAAIARALRDAPPGDLPDGARQLPALPAPGKLLFCGVNYRDHVDEVPGASLPEAPFFFAKLPSTIIGPGDAIVAPYPECRVDYEGELAVVIGRRARHVRAGEALDHVLGYVVVNDVSARDVQFVDQQITLAKNFDTFCPMGSEIVLTDEVPDPTVLEIRTLVDGEERQRGATSEMVFGVAALIARLSEVMTLDPGDVVSTGTPAGTGGFRTPPGFLVPGSTVTVRIAGLGEVTNPVVAGW
jgi:2-keto-4-pentenoate hydratase/2-oxohepta-3-ene-1,7-dioic acid hydratase in catechol pathway